MADRCPGRVLTLREYPQQKFMNKIFKYCHVLLLIIVLIGNLQISYAQQATKIHSIAKEMDRYLGLAVEQRRASGIAAGMIVDGELVFLQGYGFEGPDMKTPVDPDKTIFSIGSITKVFTATAVAQLIREGRIESIDDPANRYFKRIQLPVWDGKQISISDLLTHRAGFEDSIYGLLAESKSDLPLNSEDILQRIPKQIRRPGEISVYSNAGYGILGALVEDITGMTLSDYFHSHITGPLGMRNTYLRYENTDPPKIAQPYKFKRDGSTQLIAQNWAYHPFISASASIVSTASDMLTFLVAHLPVSHEKAPTVIDSEIRHMMQKQITTNHPQVSGFGMSFVVHDRNGVRIVENAGSGPGFQATFILIPEMRTGLVVLIMGGGESLSLSDRIRNLFAKRGKDSAAGDNGAAIKSLNMFEVRQEFLNAVIGEYIPSGFTKPEKLSSQISGMYRNERRPQSTVEALLSSGEIITIERESDTELVINGESGYQAVNNQMFWKAKIAPLAKDSTSSDIYTFTLDESGKVKYVTTHLGIDIFRPVMVAPNTLRCVGLFLLLTAATGIVGLIYPAQTKYQKFSVRIASLLGATSTVFLLSLIVAGLMGGDFLFSIAFSDLRFFILLIILANIIALISVSLIPFVVYDWKQSQSGLTKLELIRNVHHSVVLFSGLTLILIFDYFNLIGFRTP